MNLSADMSLSLDAEVYHKKKEAEAFNDYRSDYKKFSRGKSPPKGKDENKWMESFIAFPQPMFLEYVQ